MGMGDIDLSPLGLPEVQAVMKSWMSGIVIFVFLLIAAEILLRTAEWWTARQQGQTRRILPNNAIVNLLTTSVYDLTLRGVGYGVMFGFALWGYNHSHWRIGLSWWTLPAYVLAAEFWSYFMHRLMHEVRLFWADHAVHHSASEFDFTTAQRFHLFEWVPKVIAMFPLAMIGFHPLLLFLFTPLAGIQLVAHSARFGRWGWWDKWFVSPTIHGVHHSRNPIYMDRNLGGALNIWDHIFGTYQDATEEKMVFGVTHTLDTVNETTVLGVKLRFNPTHLLKVLFYEYTFLFRDFAHAPTLKDKLVVLFGRPGETFEVPADHSDGGAVATTPALATA